MNLTNLAGYVLATIAFIHFYTAVYVLAQARVGKWIGGEVLRIQVGVNVICSPFKVGWGKSKVWFGLIPLTGYTKFYGRDDELPDEWKIAYPRPRPLHALSIIGRGLLSFAGPASNVVFGLALLAIPVMQGWPQVEVHVPGQMEVPVTSGPKIEIASTAATINGQQRLVKTAFVEFFSRAFAWEAQGKLGGPCSWIVICAGVAIQSPSAWVSCLALLCLGNGILNLLPIPGYNGGRVLLLVWEAVRGPISESAELRMAVTGLLLTVAVLAYLLWLDAAWIASRIGEVI